MFTNAGERGRKAIGKVIHKGITDPDKAPLDLEAWYTKEEGLLAQRGIHLRKNPPARGKGRGGGGGGRGSGGGGITVGLQAHGDVMCRWCQKKGHKEHECRAKQRGRPKAEPKSKGPPPAKKTSSPAGAFPEGIQRSD